MSPSKNVRQHWHKLGGGPRVPKTPVYLRVDSDLVAWFRRQGSGYQSRMNSALRAFVEAHEGEETRAARVKRLERAQEAFQRYYAQCFWHLEPKLQITERNLNLVIEGLRQHGGAQGMLLAEELCR